MEKQKKKIGKTSELFWLLGIIFVALGVAVCKKADLGVSMIAATPFILSEFLIQFWSYLSVGVVEYIFQAFLLIIMCIIVRKVRWQYLFAFLVAVIYGYTLNFFIWLIGETPFQELYLRWIMLIVGDISTAFGVACFFKTYMPLEVYELLVTEIAKTYNKKVHTIKAIEDYTLLGISIILACTLFGDVNTITWEMLYSASFHSIGLGTLVTTLINSPIIAFFSHLLDKFFDHTPLFPKLEKIVKI